MTTQTLRTTAGLTPASTLWIPRGTCEETILQISIEHDVL
jgi:hypothetical protein